MSQESDYVKGRIAKFSSQVAALSAQNTPPGKNAANGIFRDALVKDPAIASAGAPAEMPLGDEAQRLFDSYLQLRQGIVDGFNGAPNHDDSWTHDIGLAFQFATEQIVKDVVGVATDIAGIVFGNAAAAAGLVAKLTADVTKLVNDVDALGIKASGANANGHIAQAVHDTAAAIIPPLSKDWSVDEAKTAAALKRACEAMTQLNTTDHKPWLRAEWQISFQGILQSLGQALA